MNWRAISRRLFIYSTVAVSGFLLAYMLVAFVIFPAEVVPDDRKVPNVVGMDFDSASRVLERAGFHAVVGESRPNTKVPASQVLDQNPVAGTAEKPGSQISLNVSAGERTITIPNVVGRTRQLAEMELATAGLQFGKVAERESESPRGEVLETSPKVGATVAPGTAIDLVVSSGPSSVQVPDVVGQNVAAAQSMLEQLGLKAGPVDADSTRVGAPGMVTSQSPAAGTRVKAGSSVSLKRAP